MASSPALQVTSGKKCTELENVQMMIAKYVYMYV